MCTKENVVNAYNGILVSYRKEENSDICCDKDEDWQHYSKWNKPDTKRQILYIT